MNVCLQSFIAFEKEWNEGRLESREAGSGNGANQRLGRAISICLSNLVFQPR